MLRLLHCIDSQLRSSERHPVLGVTASELCILEMLSAAPARSVNELAAAAKVHQSSVSTVLEQLRRKGLVNKRASKEDRRKASIVTTAKARQLVKRAHGPNRFGLPAAVETLGLRERAAMLVSLRELLHALDDRSSRAGGGSDGPAVLRV